jgi:hypothetical protein
LPEGRMARRLERECARPGLAGCSGCLRALNKVRDILDLSIASSFLSLGCFSSLLLDLFITWMLFFLW